MIIRDRYAPSPTGLQHIGGVRTALFNYLFAKSRAATGGAFILRLEDTDQARSDQAYIQNLYDTFRWLGLHWDEGPDIGGPHAPYTQSERFAVYQDHAHRLLETGHAYRCFCSSERLESLRAESAESGYDRHCRAIPKAEAERRANAGEPFVIRLAIPLGDTGGAAASTRFSDLLLGDIEWRNQDINPDPVLLKSDGFPTYHLANVVDDHLMAVSHVLRAQEWLPSTPLHILLYRAFGWAPPEFCHLPMVMGQDGKKLSKRHGSTSVDEFRLAGYLPEALINYVATLGASYEEGRELFTLEELAERFSLEKLNKAPAIFDYKKLEWFNAQYIKAKEDAALADAAYPFALESGLLGGSDEEKRVFCEAMPLIKERVSFLREIPEKIRYLFSEPPIPAAEEFFPKKTSLQETLTLLRIGRELGASLATLPTDEEAEAQAKECAARENAKLGDLLMPLRVAITGTRISPPLFLSMRILGPERSRTRIDSAIAALEAQQ